MIYRCGTLNTGTFRAARKLGDYRRRGWLERKRLEPFPLLNQRPNQFGDDSRLQSSTIRVRRALVCVCLRCNKFSFLFPFQSTARLNESFVRCKKITYVFLANYIAIPSYLCVYLLSACSSFFWLAASYYLWYNWRPGVNASSAQRQKKIQNQTERSLQSANTFESLWVGSG